LLYGCRRSEVELAKWVKQINVLRPMILISREIRLAGGLTVAAEAGISKTGFMAACKRTRRFRRWR
jgi:hypothetical protein